LNVACEQFELLDSLRDPNDADGQRVLHLMAYNIKKLWREAANYSCESFHPKSIDHWEYHYVNVPRQLTALVFLFSYVFQLSFCSSALLL
jgi:hypothetical protein